MEGKSIVGSVGGVLLALVCFIVILYLAYVATKKLGKRMSVKGIGGKNMKIIDSISIGQHGSILILQAAGKLLLVGITQNSMTVLSELDPEALSSEETVSGVRGETMDFSQAFKKALEQKFGRSFKNNKESSKNDDDSSDSEISK